MHVVRNPCRGREAGSGARCPAVQSLPLRVRAGGVFMGRTARERLASMLDDTEAPGSFSAQILAPADTLQVEVVGLGAVQTPVRGPLAKKLIAVGRPATFGRAEQTLTDTSVRDTWEITPDLVTL